MFANGTEGMVFNEMYCCRCKKYKIGEDGLPKKGNCEIEEAITLSVFEPEMFPKNVIRLSSGVGWTCDSFDTEDKKVQAEYDAWVKPYLDVLREDS